MSAAAEPGLAQPSAPRRRHAVITGGSSGIGLAVAARLVRSSWNITLIARDEERLARAGEELRRQRVTKTSTSCVSARTWRNVRRSRQRSAKLWRALAD